MIILKKKTGSLIEEYLSALKIATDKGYTITDTHAHIHFDDYKSTLKEVLKRAELSGIKKIITVGINLEDSLKAKELTDSLENIFFAAGIHPHEADSFKIPLKDRQLTSDLYDNMFSNSKCLAIGEIGLDFYRNISDKTKQIEVFEFFLDKAITYNKPVIIHTRQSSNECIEVLNRFRNKNNLRGIFHCFAGDEVIYKWALENNFYLSFAGNVTYEKSLAIRSALERVPLDRILIETDCPYLSPMPFRGKENEPFYIIFTLYTLYKIKNVELCKLMEIIEDNLKKLF
jgi:TatD DNase family protein